MPNLSLPFEKTTHGIEKEKEKMERNKTTHRTKMPGGTILSFAHPLCLGTLSFAEAKFNIEYPTDLKRSLVFFSASFLLAYCLAGCAIKPDRRWSRRRRKRCNADRGLSPPKYGRNTVVIFTKESSPNFLLLLKWHENQC